MAQATEPLRTEQSFPQTPVGICTSIVVPVHNEKGNLESLHKELRDVFQRDCMQDYRPWELLLINDGSTDGSAAVIDDLADRDVHVAAIHLQRSFGQSAALAAGFDHARGRFIVPMDGDGQNDPADIPRLLEAIDDGADCVSGWRRERNDPPSKTIPSKIQTVLAKGTGPDINDFGCTLTAYRSEALNEVELRGERHRYIPAHLHALGYDVEEREVNHRERQHGSSHYGAGRLIRGFVDLLYHLFRVRYRHRPMHLFGGLGFVLFVLGIGLGSWLLVENYFLGADLMPNLPQLLLSVTLGLFGFGLLALGLIVELLSENLYRGQRPYRIESLHE